MSNDSGTNSAGIGATIGGTAWQLQYTAGDYSSSFISLYGYYGTSGDTSMVEVDISDTVHINQADLFTSSSVYYYKSNGTIYSADAFFGGHGTITVTAWDKNAYTIAGTFSGIFYNTGNDSDSLKLENGHLKIPVV